MVEALLTLHISYLQVLAIRRCGHPLRSGRSSDPGVPAGCDYPRFPAPRLHQPLHRDSQAVLWARVQRSTCAGITSRECRLASSGVARVQLFGVYDAGS